MSNTMGAEDESDPNPLEENFIIREYRGSGLFGVVWKAEQKRPQRTVAVKIVNREHGMTFNALAHADGLVRAGAHPNIVAVHELTKVRHPDDGEEVDAIIMEWLDGQSLGERLGEKELLGYSEAKKISEGVVAG